MEGRLIREVIRYAGLHTHQVFVCYIDKDCKSFSILGEDIQILKKLGIHIILALNPETKLLPSQIDYHEVWGSPSWRGKRIPYIYLKPEEIIAYLHLVGATKLIFCTGANGIFNSENKLIKQLDISDGEALLQKQQKRSSYLVTGMMRDKLILALEACRQGIPRVHFINPNFRDSLLLELFSFAGVGTMVYIKESRYETVQKATSKDVGSIHRLLDKSGLPLEVDWLEKYIDDFYVFLIDDRPFACARLSSDSSSKSASIDFFAAENFENLDITSVFFTELLKFVPEGITKITVSLINCSYFLIHPVLSRCGFERHPTEHTWSKDL
jgi:hypothetical protein